MKSLVLLLMLLVSPALAGIIADLHKADGRKTIPEPPAFREIPTRTARSETSAGNTNSPGTRTIQVRPFDERQSLTNHGITEIGIERTACYGSCPVYTFIIKDDGTFRFSGQKWIDPTNDFTGKIPATEFHQLARFIKSSGFSELNDTYAQGGTDQATVYTLVVADGARKTVKHYGTSGPPNLWAIEKLIDDLHETAWSNFQKAKARLSELEARNARDSDVVKRWKEHMRDLEWKPVDSK